MTRESMIEIRISRDLALKIGCIEPEDVHHHRILRDGTACFLVRDPITMMPMFWPVIPASAVTYRSS